jgi:Arc/MetJ family transcription regulator
MGRTNIILDDDLVAACQKATGIKTRREIVEYALRELVRRERLKQILELKGSVKWKGNLNNWRKDRHE